MRAFTLLELLIVMAVLGILAAAPMTALRSDEARAKAAVRAVVTDLSEARALALSSRRKIGLRFLPAQNRYEFILADGTTPVESRTALEADASLDPATLARLLEAAPASDLEDATLLEADLEGSQQVLFDAAGHALAGGRIDFQSGTFKRRIRIQAGSGRITITIP